MDLRYSRNLIHIDEKDQQQLKNCKILIAGCGIGSYIAECLLRLGFENLTIVDGDLVELTNLNRQNYTEVDIGKNKAEVLKKRLLAINAGAQIEAITEYITIENLTNFKIDHTVSINALDFSTDIPFLFDEVCSKLDIPVIHPYNLGWAGFITVITAKSRNMKSLEQTHKVFELNVGKFIVENLQEKKVPTEWLERFLNEYQEIASISSPPQLSIGVHLLSGMVTHIIYNIVTNKPVKEFPESYYLSLHS